MEPKFLNCSDAADALAAYIFDHEAELPEGVVRDATIWADAPTTRMVMCLEALYRTMPLPDPERAHEAMFSACSLIRQYGFHGKAELAAEIMAAIA